MTVRIIRENHAVSARAYAAHAALLKAERADPTLKDNPYWTVLKQDAYTRFREAFDA